MAAEGMQRHGANFFNDEKDTYLALKEKKFKEIAKLKKQGKKNKD